MMKIMDWFRLAQERIQWKGFFGHCTDRVGPTTGGEFPD
jgi:hypothetical protein